MGGGVSRSSNEAGNDRGAKGWQIVGAGIGKLSACTLCQVGEIDYDNET